MRWKCLYVYKSLKIDENVKNLLSRAYNFGNNFNKTLWLNAEFKKREMGEVDLIFVVKETQDPSSISHTPVHDYISAADA